MKLVNALKRTALLVVFILLSVSALAWTVELLDNSGKGAVDSATCSDCWQDYRICNNNILFSKTISANNFNINFYNPSGLRKDLKNEYGRGRSIFGVKNIEMFIIEGWRKEIVKEKVVVDEIEECVDLANGSNCYEIPVEAEMQREITTPILTKLNPHSLALQLGRGDCVDIRIIGKLLLGGRVDVVLSIDGREYKQWAWWDNINSNLVAVYNLNNKNTTNAVSSPIPNLIDAYSGSDVIQGVHPTGATVPHYNANAERMQTSSAVDLGANVSLCFWFNRTASSTGYWSRYAPTGDYDYFDIVSYASPNVIRFQKYNNTGSYITISVEVNNNQWYHTCFVKNQTDIWVYINGVLNATKTSTAGVTGTAADTIKIGDATANNPSVAIDEFYLWNRTLTAEEVAGVYANFYPFEEPPPDPSDPPTYSNLQNNASTTTKVNDTAKWSATFYDDIQLVSYTFSINQTGVWVNDSEVNISGVEYNVSVTKTIVRKRDTKICGKFYIKDNSANITETNESCFTVANTPPSLKSVYYASTHYNRTFDNIMCYASTFDADNDTLTLNFNFTGKIQNATVYNDYCIEDVANQTSECNAGLGSYKTENNAVNPFLAYDADWNTYSYASAGYANYYINYTIPSGALETSQWIVKIGGTNYTVSIPAECWNNPLQFQVISYGDPIQVLAKCYNGSGYEDILLVEGNKNFYEEAMKWLYEGFNAKLNNSMFEGGEIINCTAAAYDLSVWSSPLSNTTYIYPILNITLMNQTGELLTNWNLKIFYNDSTTEINSASSPFSFEKTAHIHDESGYCYNTTLLFHKPSHYNFTLQVEGGTGTSCVWKNDSSDWHLQLYLPTILFIPSIPKNTTRTTQVEINITTPSFLNGTLTYYYETNTGESGIICSNCLNYSGYIPLTTYGQHYIIIHSESPYYTTQSYNLSSKQYFSNITLILIDEKDNSLFNTDNLDGLMLYQVCPDGTLPHTNLKIINQSNITNFYTECNYTKLKIYAQLGSSSYFRSKIPEQNETETKFYLINLRNDSAVNINLRFEGLDAFANPHIIIYSGNREIIRDTPDIENKIIAYLMQNGEYIVGIASGGNVKILGNIVAEVSEIKIIRLNPLDLSNVISIAGGNIEIAYEISETYIRAHYLDKTGENSLVNLTIYNFTIDSPPLWSSETTGSNITFTWNTPIDSETYYLTEIIINHNTFGTLRQTNTLRMGAGTYGSLIDLFAELPPELKNRAHIWLSYGVIMFIILTMLAFSMVNSKIGMFVTSAEVLFFWYIGWLNITSGAITIIITLLIANILSKKVV